jgi:hypothetical protein
MYVQLFKKCGEYMGRMEMVIQIQREGMSIGNEHGGWLKRWDISSYREHARGVKGSKEACAMVGK